MTQIDLDFLDAIEGLEETGEQDTHESGGFRAFRGLKTYRLNARTGTYKAKDGTEVKNFNGAVLAYNEVRAFLCGMSTPKPWEIALAHLKLPSDRPLCTWEGGKNEPRVNDSLADDQIAGLMQKGAGGDCRSCSLGNWSEAEGKRIKPACDKKFAILFLEWDAEKGAFKDAPIVIGASNYRSVDAVLGKWRKKVEDRMPSLEERSQEYAQEEFKRAVPLIVLKATIDSKTFSTSNGDFHQSDYRFHGAFKKDQVIEALKAFQANNIFEPDPDAALPPAQEPALLPAASPQPEGPPDAEDGQAVLQQVSDTIAF